VKTLLQALQRVCSSTASFSCANMYGRVLRCSVASSPVTCN